MESKKIYTVDELKLKQDTFIILVWKRNSGKSVYCRNLIIYYINNFDFDFIILFWETAQFNKDYDFLGEEWIFKYNKFDKVIWRVLNMQEKNRTKNKKVHGLVVLDDIPLWKKWETLNTLACMSRHYYLTLIISVQYAKWLIWTQVRNNIDYLFIWDVNYNMIECLYDVMSIPMTKQEFRDYLLNNNSEYTFLFYNWKEKNRDERLKLTRAKLYEKIKFVKK